MATNGNTIPEKHCRTTGSFTKTSFGQGFYISAGNVLFWSFAQLDLPDFGLRSISLQTSSAVAARCKQEKIGGGFSFSVIMSSPILIFTSFLNIGMQCVLT